MTFIMSHSFSIRTLYPGIPTDLLCTASLISMFLFTVIDSSYLELSHNSIITGVSSVLSSPPTHSCFTRLCNDSSDHNIVHFTDLYSNNTEYLLCLRWAVRDVAGGKVICVSCCCWCVPPWLSSAATFSRPGCTHSPAGFGLSSYWYLRW